MRVRWDGKLVSIFLWHHNLGGSKPIDAETYPEGSVRAYVGEHFFPVHFSKSEGPEVE